MLKPIPIGCEDFKRIINRDMYYVDKTAMIKELIDAAASVTLFTRPRRFGKTLNQSMLKYFFELELDGKGQAVDNRYLFNNLKIASSGEQYMVQQGKYPVIDLSLKSAKQPNFKLAYACLVDEIVKEYERHAYILEGDSITEENKERYRSVIRRQGDEVLYIKSLEFLSQCLKKYHGVHAIMLIDEYDVPLENAYFEGFYEEMVHFIRSLFESALKTNDSLEFAVITGCLRISRESIFTGLNNLKVCSVLSPGFADCFGFTEAEVKQMLAYYKIEDKFEEVRRWYDGYLFGGIEIYNPWSIINYVETAKLDHNAFAKPYWSNTSSNNIIKELVEAADFKTRGEIEDLIAGETIEKPVHEEITYGDIHESRDNLWNFLYFTGYLKKTGERQQDDDIYLDLAIPNTEVRSIYRNTILTWFDRKVRSTDMLPLFKAIEERDCESFGNFVSDQLLDTISFFDYAENYYHGFLTGLLKTSSKYLVYSNRESGKGRPDIVMKTASIRGAAIILELKTTNEYQKMESLCQKALDQIEEQNYEAELQKEGYSHIIKYGICFYRKECMVKAKVLERV